VNPQTLAAYATVLGVGLALGAAIVGGIWRLWTWRQTHETLVTVEIGMAFLGFGANLIEAITVTVYNRSQHAIRVTGIAVETNDGSKRAFAQIVPQVSASIPGVIEPHESGMTWFEKDRLLAEGGLNLQRPTRCRITVADRPGFIWSKRRQLEGKG